MSPKSLSSSAFVSFAAASCLSSAFGAPVQKVDFAREIRPILSNNCFHCHGPDDKNRKGNGDHGFRLDTKEGAFASLDGAFGIVPGHPEKSSILERIHSKDADEVMPPPKTGKKLSEKEVALLKRWIQEGAEYAGHWAYTAPKRPEVPAVSHPTWGSHPVDRFLYQRLVAEGLKPSAQADRRTLARRIALDLTGLPPSPEEVAFFEKDARPEALSIFVDLMLAKPAFGEHWARMWMDLARYADSAGYPSDPGRSIWAYRDYVIRAFNSNKPFDSFTIEQLAGDLLPNASEEQIIATAFHRNTMTNNEGGTSDEEFRNAAVIDRVNTTWSVWMGSSMACAQCHTHKFDPLTQKEYFSFYAILNQTEDADRNDEAPLHQFYLPEEKAAKEALEAKLAALEAQFKKPKDEWLKGFNAWDASFPREVAWQKPSPKSVRSMRGSQVTVREDASVWVAAPEKGDLYKVELPLQEGSLEALKFESVPDAKLPGGGASHGGNGAFTVDALRATLVPGGVVGKSARFLRVELTGATRPLQIAELEALADGKNVAKGSVVSSSDVHADKVAARAVDGKTEGADSVFTTRGEKPGEFLEVDLGSMHRVEKVRITIPAEGGYYLGGFKLTLLDEARKSVWSQVESDQREAFKEFEPVEGQAVKFREVYASAVAGGFEAQTVVGLKANGANNRNKGWSAPAGNKPQKLTLVPEKPLQVKAGDVLRVEIDQQTRPKEQHIASFSVSVSSDPGAELQASVPVSLQAVALAPAEKRNAQQAAQWLDYYVRNRAPETEAERKEFAATKKDLDATKPNTVPILRELESAKQRVTKVQIRGNYLNLGDEVHPGIPAVFPQPSLPAEAKVDRLAMARWLVGPENPLTARVTVNRFWETIFGVGIVRTSEEFGAQGEMPVHPELLDWLATEFVKMRWDVKAFLKMLVMSEAYRQSSVVSPELQEKDPENRFAARGPRFRASAEVLRDQALFVAGLLSPKMYGKAVRPPKPDMGLSTAFGGGNDWVPSTGEDRYRRAIYTEIRRNSPYPSFSTFDAPNREVCTLRRGRTNTPLQALVTLNDPAFIEAAQALARRIFKEAAADKEQRIRYAFDLVLSRAPSAHEVARLGKLLDQSFAGFSSDKERALQMATQPLGPLPKDADVAEHAAWTAFCNVLLNLDETLMRR